VGHSTRVLSAPIAAFALALATTAAGPAGCPELESLLRATRTQQSVAWVPVLVRQILAKSDDDESFSTAGMERLVEIALEAYAPAELARDIENSLRSRCDAERVAQANAFYRSPLGVKIVRGGLELLRSSGRADEALYFEQLRQEGLDSGRLELVRSVKSAGLVHAVPPRVRLALLRPLALVTARAVAAEHGATPPTDAEVASRIADDSARQNGYFDLLADLAQLFSTRDLSAAELQAYRAFLGSSAGVWYRESLNLAFENALDAAGRRLIAAAASR